MAKPKPPKLGINSGALQFQHADGRASHVHGRYCVVSFAGTGTVGWSNSKPEASAMAAGLKVGSFIDVFTNTELEPVYHGKTDPTSG